MLANLDREARLQLVKFVCSFAWADLVVTDAEREYVTNLIQKLDLDDEEAVTVRGCAEEGEASEVVVLDVSDAASEIGEGLSVCG